MEADETLEETVPMKKMQRKKLKEEEKKLTEEEKKQREKRQLKKLLTLGNIGVLDQELDAFFASLGSVQDPVTQSQVDFMWETLVETPILTVGKWTTARVRAFRNRLHLLRLGLICEDLMRKLGSSPVIMGGFEDVIEEFANIVNKAKAKKISLFLGHEEK